MSDAPKDATEAVWEAARDAGTKAFQDADYPGAERLLRQSLEVARQILPRDWLPHVWSLDYLMLAYQVQGKEAELVDLRKQARVISDDLMQQAAVTRQNARTVTDLERSMTLQQGARFYQRRANWRGKGSAEVFAKMWPPFLPTAIQEKMVWAGKEGVKQDAILHIDSGPGWVLLTVDARFCNAGEAQVSHRPDECEVLADALQQAISHASGR